MTVIYDQSGELNIGGVVFTAYSGHGAGLNNPAMEALHDIGPIPRGQWRVVEWCDHYDGKGPCVARLAPVGHDAHGRSGFLAHGRKTAGDVVSSHGCIVADRDARQAWRNSGDLDLLVQ